MGNSVSANFPERAQIKLLASIYRSLLRGAKCFPENVILSSLLLRHQLCWVVMLLENTRQKEVVLRIKNAYVRKINEENKLIKEKIELIKSNKTDILNGKKKQSLNRTYSSGLYFLISRLMRELITYNKRKMYENENNHEIKDAFFAYKWMKRLKAIVKVFQNHPFFLQDAQFFKINLFNHKRSLFHTFLDKLNVENLNFEYKVTKESEHDENLYSNAVKNNSYFNIQQNLFWLLYLHFSNQNKIANLKKTKSTKAIYDHILCHKRLTFFFDVFSQCGNCIFNSTFSVESSKFYKVMYPYFEAKGISSNLFCSSMISTASEISSIPANISTIPISSCAPDFLTLCFPLSSFYNNENEGRNLITSRIKNKHGKAKIETAMYIKSRNDLRFLSSFSRSKILFPALHNYQIFQIKNNLKTKNINKFKEFLKKKQTIRNATMRMYSYDGILLYSWGADNCWYNESPKNFDKTNKGQEKNTKDYNNDSKNLENALNFIWNFVMQKKLNILHFDDSAKRIREKFQQTKIKKRSLLEMITEELFLNSSDLPSFFFQHLYSSEFVAPSKSYLLMSELSDELLNKYHFEKKEKEEEKMADEFEKVKYINSPFGWIPPISLNSMDTPIEIQIDAVCSIFLLASRLNLKCEIVFTLGAKNEKYFLAFFSNFDENQRFSIRSFITSWGAILSPNELQNMLGVKLVRLIKLSVKEILCLRLQNFVKGWMFHDEATMLKDLESLIISKSKKSELASNFQVAQYFKKISTPQFFRKSKVLCYINKAKQQCSIVSQRSLIPLFYNFIIFRKLKKKKDNRCQITKETSKHSFQYLDNCNQSVYCKYSGNNIQYSIYNVNKLINEKQIDSLSNTMIDNNLIEKINLKWIHQMSARKLFRIILAMEILCRIDSSHALLSENVISKMAEVNGFEKILDTNNLYTVH